MCRLLFSSAAFATFFVVFSPSTATAQYGDIARAQAQAQLRGQALQRAIGNRTPVYRMYRQPIYAVPTYQSNFYHSNSYFGGAYYGYPQSGFGYYSPGYFGRGYRRPLAPRLPTTGSHYFGDPHASQYFPR